MAARTGAPDPRLSLSPRKSLSSAAARGANNASTMPPPSAPVQRQPSPREPLLLEEVAVMQSALKASVVKAGEVFKFQTDAGRAGVVKHTVRGPRSASLALHRSIERYQQAYDSLEAQLLHALAVVEHDLEREKARIDAKHAVERTGSSPAPADDEATQLSLTTTIAAASAGGTATARRQSTLVLSSLHHRAPPLRLDLSSVMPISPVTLAPRTATAAAEFAGTDFLSAHAASIIDLTMSDTAPLPTHIGGTSDHPIDVDMDSASLFGDEPPSVPGAQRVTDDVLHNDANADLFESGHGDREQELFGSLTGASADPASTTAFLDALTGSDVPPDSNNLLAELELQLQPTMESAVPELVDTSLADLGIDGIDSSLEELDPSLAVESSFMPDGMPPEMMAFMDIDVDPFSSLSGNQASGST